MLVVCAEAWSRCELPTTRLVTRETAREVWFEEWMRESGCRIRNGSLCSVAQIEVEPARQRGEGRLARDGTSLGWRRSWTEHEQKRMYAVRSVVAVSGGCMEISRFLNELVSNRQRVLQGPKCSWVLPAASRLSFQSSGCLPRPPRSGIWRLVGEAGDGCTRSDVTAAFEPRDRRDRCGLAGRWMGVWLEMWARKQVVRFEPALSRLRGSETQGSRLTQVQGSRELSSQAADARKVGLGRAEVGGGAGWCGHHGALGPVGKRILLP